MTTVDRPVVSVVIPFFGDASTLSGSLQSVRDQSFDERVETIVVDDGSGVDLGGVREEFDDVVFVRRCNGGAGVARNDGIDMARGDFVAFLDADDRWLPSKLAVQVESMRATGCAWSQHSYLVTSPDMRVLRRVDTSRYDGDVLRDTLLSFRVQTSTVMVKRECFQDTTLRFSADRIGEDGHFFSRMALQFPLVAIADTLGCFTWHGSNVGGRVEAQLWSRARTWQQNKELICTSLPRSGQLAYRWCALASRALGYSPSGPPAGRSRAAATVGYLPSYLTFQYLARRHRA